MVKSCAAYNCQNRQVKGGPSFHRFPLNNEPLLKEWVVALRRCDYVPTEHSFLCSEHFAADAFEKRPNGRCRLKSNAVPSIFNFQLMHEKSKQRKRIRLKQPVRNMAPNQPSFSAAPTTIQIETFPTNDFDQILTVSQPQDTSNAFVPPDPTDAVTTLLYCMSNEGVPSEPADPLQVATVCANEAMLPQNCNKDAEDFISEEQKVMAIEHSYATCDENKHSEIPSNPMEMKKKIVNLQNKLYRYEKRWENIYKQISELKEKNMITEEGWKILAKNFGGVRKKNKEKERDLYFRQLMVSCGFKTAIKPQRKPRVRKSRADQPKKLLQELFNPQNQQP